MSLAKMLVLFRLLLRCCYFFYGILNLIKNNFKNIDTSDVGNYEIRYFTKSLDWLRRGHLILERFFFSQFARYISRLLQTAYTTWKTIIYFIINLIFFRLVTKILWKVRLIKNYPFIPLIFFSVYSDETMQF